MVGLGLEQQRDGVGEVGADRKPVPQAREVVPFREVDAVCTRLGTQLGALVGYAFAVHNVPSAGATAFDALGAVVMATGLLMGTAVLWLCVRGDPSL